MAKKKNTFKILSGDLFWVLRRLSQQREDRVPQKDPTDLDGRSKEK